MKEYDIAIILYEREIRYNIRCHYSMEANNVTKENT